MKKLMIAAAIVCAAVFCQAATINWTSSSSKLVDKTGATLASVTKGSIVAIILTTTTGWDAGTWTAKASSVTELGATTIGSGTKTKGKANGDLTFSYGTTLNNNDVVAVVFKDTDGSYSQLAYYDKSNGMVTDTLKVSGLDSELWTGELTFATKGNFMAESVPEPTSAMLLLLGMAGLALRRKRA